MDSAFGHSFFVSDSSEIQVAVADSFEFGLDRLPVVGMLTFLRHTFGTEAVGVEAGHLPRFSSEGRVASVAEFGGEEVVVHFSVHFVGEWYEGEFRLRPPPPDQPIR